MYRPTEISASAPTVNDDYANGFRNGNYWHNTATSIHYILTDHTTANAVWSPISSGSVDEWDDWTTTITWTGNTPTGVSYVARYITIGEVCCFTLDVSCTTGGIGNLTDMTFTLPEQVADNNNLIPISSFYMVAASPLNTNIAYIDGTDNTPANRIAKHFIFPVVGTATAFDIYFRGFYEWET